MAELEMNLYDMNKQIMDKFEVMDKEALSKHIFEVTDWMAYNINRYFMLLCHERRDYTIFNFKNRSKRSYEASQELEETLVARGDILDFRYVPEDCYEIWIKIDGESFLYHLFPYDIGVVEI